MGDIKYVFDSRPGHLNCIIWIGGLAVHGKDNDPERRKPGRAGKRDREGEGEEKRIVIEFGITSYHPHPIWLPL